MTKEQNKVSNEILTIEEKIAVLISEFGYECMNYSGIKSTEEYVTQIISLVKEATSEAIRADERKRILDEIESKEYLTAEDMQFIYKLLRPESDTEK